MIEIEIERLRQLLNWMEDKLKRLEARKANLMELLSYKGYSIKTIKGERYLYVWRTTGHGKAKWKCLGNLNKKQNLIESIKERKIEQILEEIRKLEEEKENIRRRLEEAYKILSG